MSDVLVFVQQPDGTLVPQVASATEDGQTVTPSGLVTAVAPQQTITTTALSFLTTVNGQEVQQLYAAGNPGSTVVAQQKLAQRFLLHLLTAQGSILYRPTQGCSFVQQLRIGKAASENDIFAAFAGAMPDVTQNMQIEELSTDPPEERFGSAQMTNLTLNKGSIVTTITLNSLAQVPLNLILPLNFLL
jgi:hypothetical protein